MSQNQNPQLTSIQGIIQSILAGLTQIVSPILDWFSPAEMYAFPQSVYPGQVNRYDFMTGGYTYIIDILNNQIVQYTNQTGPFNTTVGQTVTKLNLPSNVAKKIKSALIFVSDADTVITVNGTAGFGDHKLYHIFNNLDNTLPIMIMTPAGKLPNTMDLNFVLSTKAINPYDIDKQLAHTKKSNTVTTTGAAPTWTTVLTLHIGGYDNLTAMLVETGGVNAAAWQVLASEDDVTYNVIQGVTFTNISAGSYQTFTTNIKWHFYKFQVAAAVGGSNATVKASASPIR